MENNWLICTQKNSEREIVGTSRRLSKFLMFTTNFSKLEKTWDGDLVLVDSEIFNLRKSQRTETNLPMYNFYRPEGTETIISVNTESFSKFEHSTLRISFSDCSVHITPLISVSANYLVCSLLNFCECAVDSTFFWCVQITLCAVYSSYEVYVNYPLSFYSLRSRYYIDIDFEPLRGSFNLCFNIILTDYN